MIEGTSAYPGVDAFQHSLRQAYGRFDAMPLSEQATGHATSIASKALPSLDVTASNVISRRPALGAEWGDNAFLLMIVEGSLVLDHYGRQASLGVGDMALLDSREGCRIEVPDTVNALTIGLPRSDVVAVRLAMENVFGLAMPGNRPINRIVSGTIGSILHEDCDDVHVTAIRSAVMSLIDQALGSDDQMGGTSPAERALLGEMADWVLKNPEAVEEGVEAMAARFALSRRSLYRLFSRFGTSPSRWIADVRLRHAYRMLTAGGDESVSAVAFACGFSDCSHFARAFRQRFGVRPSELRKRQTQGLYRTPGGSRLS
ncbi:helix-turn-helix domain-containing protein [Croceicoccus sediminis]|uniref:helix-turn-helix domain-containing protein n=1 Tax=Croceicoccus sediminis TaxID=2571150 RepID=UPI0014783795|nr:helix-turn-helix domain-containing protein [Croceicoccus sediminis]